MRHTFKFEFSPKIIVLLGEELIHDHKIAISELVKNAYDADANTVKIKITPHSIIIEDDGIGMGIDIIKNVWLKPGVSSKNKSNPQRTKKYHRHPLGEKGIGRLGVHRLGNKIELYSKSENTPEVHFSIDWKLFEECDSLNDIEPIKVIENDVPEVMNATGTKIIIKDLKEQFTDADIQNISSDLQKLQSPFQSIDDFIIQLYHHNGLFVNQEEITIDDIKHRALFEFNIEFRKNRIINFEYKLLTNNNHKVKPRIITKCDLEKVIHNFENIESTVDLGAICFRGYIYEYKLATVLGEKIDKDIKDYLKVNGGIRVYRDRMRVYNYGEEGKDNDILNLDKTRAKKLGDHIGFNQILASVELSRDGSSGLTEKTNREGFIHNEAFAYFRNALNKSLEIVNKLRQDDKEQLKLAYIGKEYDKGEISVRVENIISTVKSFEIEDKKKEKIITQLQSFSKEFKHIKDVFLHASNAGLNLTFVIHEIDKIIDGLEKALKEKKYDFAESIFLHLKNVVLTYKQAIKIDKKTSSHQLLKIVNQSVFNFQYRFDSHSIEIITEVAEDLHIVAKKNLIVGAFTNILDNAAYWLKEYKIKSKKIYIKAYQESNELNVIIADNGNGFNMSFESAKSPFISGRFDESSMGIGLHLVEQIMQAHYGRLTHSSSEYEALPAEFSHGAILKLVFNTEM